MLGGVGGTVGRGQDDGQVGVHHRTVAGRPDAGRECLLEVDDRARIAQRRQRVTAPTVQIGQLDHESAGYLDKVSATPRRVLGGVESTAGGLRLAGCGPGRAPGRIEPGPGRRGGSGTDLVEQRDGCPWFADLDQDGGLSGHGLRLGAGGVGFGRGRPGPIEPVPGMLGIALVECLPTGQRRRLGQHRGDSGTPGALDRVDECSVELVDQGAYQLAGACSAQLVVEPARDGELLAPQLHHVGPGCLGRREPGSEPGCARGLGCTGGIPRW